MAHDICNKCQRFFKRNGKQYCEKCDSELNSSRQSINEYLEANPGSTILEIVKETGVKLKDVNLFLKTGGAYTTNSYSEKEFKNLRQEELQEEQALTSKREDVKLRNKFRSRRLRGD